MLFEKCCNFYPNNFKFFALKRNYKYLKRYCAEISITVFYRKNKYSKILNGDDRETSMERSCGAFRGPNKGHYRDICGRSVKHAFLKIQLTNALT